VGALPKPKLCKPIWLTDFSLRFFFHLAGFSSFYFFSRSEINWHLIYVSEERWYPCFLSGQVFNPTTLLPVHLTTHILCRPVQTNWTWKRFLKCVWVYPRCTPDACWYHQVNFHISCLLIWNIFIRGNGFGMWDGIIAQSILHRKGKKRKIDVRYFYLKKVAIIGVAVAERS